MKVVIVIPARMESTRLPGKPLLKVRNEHTLLELTWRRAKATIATHVLITSPDKAILQEAEKIGAAWYPSTAEQPTGTHRVAEVVEVMSRKETPDIIINWQVDEPLVDPRDVDGLIRWIGNQGEEAIGTLVAPLPPALVDDGNTVKVAVSRDECHWFSRAPLEGAMAHCGIYGFGLQALTDATSYEPSGLSEAASLEQLTWLEAGLTIHALGISALPLSINTAEDMRKLRQRFKSRSR